MSSTKTIHIIYYDNLKFYNIIKISNNRIKKIVF